MRFAIRCGLLALACSAFLSGAVRAAEDDASLADGPSRAELFEARMKAEYGPTVIGNAISRPFVIPSDVLGDAVYGIDLSHHNDGNCVCKAGQKCSACKIDWSRAARQKIGFAYVKATQGAHFKDPTFDYHWRALGRSGIARGAVHFMSADQDPIEQADHFVDKLLEAGKLGPADLPPCLDLEADMRRDAAKKWIVIAETGEKLDFWKGQEPEEIMGKILRWLRRVEERTGRTPIVYTSRAWWRDRIQDDKKFAVLKRYPIWIANYPESGRPSTDSPKVPNDQNWTLWHFGDNAIMRDTAIVPGNFDISIFKGSLANFRKTLGVSDAPEVALTDEAADAGQPGQQVASLTPPAPTPEIQKSASASPPTESKKTPPEPRVNSNAASEAGKPSAETSKSASPPSAPVQQAAITTPPSAPPAAQPPAVTPPPAASKSTDQTASITPAPKVSVPPAAAPSPAPPVAVPPAAAASAPPPAAAPPAAAAASAPPPAAAAPSTSAATNAGTDAGSGAKTPPAPAASSSSASRSRPAGTRVAEAAAVAKGTAEKTAAEKTSAEKTANAPGEKSMIEIELPNGRKLRFDANIDPALLARLIAAIDK